MFRFASAVHRSKYILKIYTILRVESADYLIKSDCNVIEASSLIVCVRMYENIAKGRKYDLCQIIHQRMHGYS